MPTTRPRRRLRLRMPTVALLLALLLLALHGSPAQAAPTGWTFQGGTALVGASDKNLDKVESAIGRKVAVVRVYYRYGQTVPNADDAKLSAGGRMLHVSLKPKDSAGNFIQLKDIAAGRYDSYFLTQLKNLYALPTPVFFSFDHEADNSDSQGACSKPGTHSVCGPEFAAAWKHLRTLAANNNLDDRVYWSWTLTGFGFTKGGGYRAQYYWPGAGYVDWIGADSYDGSCGGTPRTFDKTSSADVKAFAEANAPNLPIIVPETGSSVDSFQPTFINSIASTLQLSAWNNYRGVEWWNAGDPDGCDYTIDDNPKALTAFKALANTPYFMATGVKRAASSGGGGGTGSVSVSITKPASGATVKGTITITGSATAASGVKSVQLRIDGAWVAGDTASPYSFGYDTHQLANGNHTITLVAWDTSGNSAEVSRTVKVAN